MKREFDSYRARQQPHPLMVEYGVDAVPFAHEQLEFWRDSLRGGIQYQVPKTTLLIAGGVDDIWQNPKHHLIIVDYKATSKAQEVNLDAEWQDGYKRQMEIYQWLFRKNDFEVDDVGIFVYCNGKADAEEFKATLCFDIKLIPYEGKTDWVEDSIRQAYDCLMADKVPDASEDCDYCRYRNAVENVLTVT